MSEIDEFKDIIGDFEAISEVRCKCGDAFIRYDIIGEDLYSAQYHNTRIVKDGYGKACICKSCGTKYDHFDHCMVRFTSKIHNVLTNKRLNHE